MSSPVDRELISQVAIVLGVCIGTWMLFIRPKADSLASMDAEITQGRARIEAVDHKRIRTVGNRIPEILNSLTDIKRRSQLARDSAELYTQIMSLALLHGIQVRTLEPNVREMNDQVGVTRILISVEGDFDRLAGFVQSVGEVQTFMRISTVNITPIEREDHTSTFMQIGCEALAFSIPPDLAVLQGTEP